MRRTFAMSAVTVFAVVLAGCGGRSGSVADGPSVVALTSSGAPVAVSHGGPVRDHVSFVDGLRARGVVVQVSGSVRQPWLRPPGTELRLTGPTLAGPATLQSYNYDSTDLGTDAAGAVRRDAAGIAPDGTPKTAGASWQGPAHWFRADRLLVLYAGSDPAVLALLTGTVGAQFAGA